jgi:epoxyqueuosine reductase QueG
MTWSQVESAFGALLADEGRAGVLAAVPVADVMLLDEQRDYLTKKLAPLGLPKTEVTAVSMGIAYAQAEIDPIPSEWGGSEGRKERWNEYAAAYHELNRCLSRLSRSIAERFGGVAEGPTREGVVGLVNHVTDYFPTCVSHRAFAEASGLGWRGRHQLIVTPEFGPALRLATVFLPGRLLARRRDLAGCGECEACVELCPVLRRGLESSDMNVYREMCRKRIKGLGLDADVCGLCVRRCWETVVPGREM